MEKISEQRHMTGVDFKINGVELDTDKSKEVFASLLEELAFHKSFLMSNVDSTLTVMSFDQKDMIKASIDAPINSEYLMGEEKDAYEEFLDNFDTIILDEVPETNDILKPRVREMFKISMFVAQTLRTFWGETVFVTKHGEKTEISIATFLNDIFSMAQFTSPIFVERVDRSILK